MKHDAFSLYFQRLADAPGPESAADQLRKLLTGSKRFQLGADFHPMQTLEFILHRVDEVEDAKSALGIAKLGGDYGFRSPSYQVLAKRVVLFADEFSQVTARMALESSGGGHSLPKPPFLDSENPGKT